MPEHSGDFHIHMYIMFRLLLSLSQAVDLEQPGNIEPGC